MMDAQEDSDFSLGKEIAKFVAENFERLFSVAKSGYRQSEAKVRVRLEKTFTQYSLKIWTTYSRGQSFFVREPTFIYDFYVSLPVQYTSSKNRVSRIDSPDACDCFKSGNAVVITGGGGSGKSMFVRHLIINSLHKSLGAPIFIELRNYQEGYSLGNILRILYDAVILVEASFTYELLVESIKLGHFIVFLDGFDELNEQGQKEIGAALQKFRAKFPSTRILVASRPDNIFSQWNGFNYLQMAPLNKSDAIKFIDSQKFDQEIIELFKKDLRRLGFFEKHVSFLSNPLLLTIMLLTYGHNAAVPKRLSEFYENAYEALFQRHDILKGGYKRPRVSGLDYSDFSQVFSAFCIHSYYEKVVAFNGDQLEEYVEKAKETSQLSFKNEDFVKDCVKAVCLLVEEGLRYVFAHRSFQEYFSAKFIASCPDDIAVSLLRKLEGRMGFDRVHEIVHEINPLVFESHYLAKRLTEIATAIEVKKKMTITSFVKFLKRNYDMIQFSEGRIRFLCMSGGGRNFKDHHIVRIAAKLSSMGQKSTSDSLADKYAPKGVGETTRIEDFTSKSDFVKDLFKDDGFISGRGLDLIFDLPAKFSKKESDKKTSLKDILSPRFSKGS